MDFLFVILNALAYVVITVSYWRRYKRVDLYMFISSLYAFTAVMCCFYFASGDDIFPDLGLTAFIYLFVVLMVFFAPIRNFDLNNKTITIEDNKWLQILGIIYLFSAIVVIITLLSHTSELIQSGMWAEMRDMGYHDEETVKLYETPFQKIAMNLVGYLRPFALVYANYQLTKPKISSMFTLGLFLSIFITSFMFAAADASRGMIINLFVQLFICYLLFKNYIPPKRKKYILFVASWVAYGFIAFIVAVSISRFGDEMWDYIFMYLGHSMLKFNDGLFYNMHDYAWGKKFFDYIFELIGLNSSYDTTALGATCAGSFVTFVGSLFIDFGPFGTIIVGLIAVYIIKRFFEKEELYLSDMIMIVFYSNTMANGIFVSSRNRALTWIMTFVVYYIVYKIETRKEEYAEDY